MWRISSKIILNCTRTMRKNERKPLKPPATKNRPVAVGIVIQALAGDGIGGFVT
jgi:hypothetical protein